MKNKTKQIREIVRKVKKLKLVLLLPQNKVNLEATWKKH